MYDEALAARIRAVFEGRVDVSERKMFGGLAFLVRGHMCCGIVGDELMVRVGPDAFASALAQPHARVMDFTGRPSRGMVYVAAAGLRNAKSLREWIARGMHFVDSLPEKSPATNRTRSRSAAPHRFPSTRVRR